MGSREKAKAKLNLSPAKEEAWPLGSNRATDEASYLGSPLAAPGREGTATEKLGGASPLRAGEVFANLSTMMISSHTKWHNSLFALLSGASCSSAYFLILSPFAFH